MRKRGKKLLAIMLAASMTLGQGSTWTLAQEEVAETIEGAALNAQAEETDFEESVEENPSEDTEEKENPEEGKDGGSEGDGSLEGIPGSGDDEGDGSPEGEDQEEDGKEGDNSDGIGRENDSNGDGNLNGDPNGEPANPNDITDGEEDNEKNSETDVAYVNSLKMSDENAIVDGTVPFDSDNNQGNDSGAANKRIRSYDTITYSVDATVQSHDTSKKYGSGRVGYKFIIPNDPELSLNQATMGWAEGWTEEIQGDNRIYTMYRNLPQTNGTAIPGGCTVTFVLDVGGKKEGDSIQPEIQCWCEGNSTMQTVTPEKVTVTSAPKYNIVLKSNSASAINLQDLSNNQYHQTNDDIRGYNVDYAFTVQIRNDNLDKGIKGTEFPDSSQPVSFDLDLHSTFTPDGADATATDITNDYTPILYAIRGNGFEALDSTKVSNNVVWSLPLTWGRAGFDGKECYQSGECSIVQEGAKLHVTIRGFAVDKNSFPKSSIDEKEIYIMSDGKALAGCFTTFGFSLIQPVKIGDNSIQSRYNQTDGTVTMTVTDGAMNVTSVCGNVVSDQTKTDDDTVSSSRPLRSGGKYDQEIFYSDSQLTEGTSGTNKLDGSDSAVIGSSLAFSCGFGDREIGSADLAPHTVAYNQFVKIDDKAIEITRSTKMSEVRNNGWKYTAQYVTLAGGWLSDEDMKTAVEGDSHNFKYFNSYDEMKASGENCVGMLFKFRGCSEKTSHNMVQVRIKVKSDYNLSGRVCQLTESTKVWLVQDLTDATVREKMKILNGEELTWQNYRDYSQKYFDESIPTNNSVNCSGEKYRPATYDENGYKGDEVAGWDKGDSLYLVPYTTKVSKLVEQKNGNEPKKTYDIDAGQRYVDFSLASEIEFGQDTSVNLPDDWTTTVTFSDTLPKDLTYIPGSGYFGGTYEEKTPDKGQVIKGQLLEPQVAEKDGTTILTWTVERVKVKAGELPLIHYSCEIGDRVKPENDVANNQQLKTEVKISTTEDKRNNTVTYGNLSKTGIKMVKLKSFNISKIGDDSIEINGTGKFELVVNNSAQTAKENIYAVDILPQDDVKGTVKKGTYKITSLRLDIDAIGEISDVKFYYTSDKKYSEKNASDIKLDEITDGWLHATLNPDGRITAENGLNDSWPTAIAYVDDSLAGMKSAHITMEYRGDKGAQDDKLVNYFSVPDLETSATADVYDRSLDGIVWFDKNNNGGYENGEELLENIPVKLYKIENGQRNTKPFATTTTDKKGYYRFNELPAGEFEVVFESSNNVPFTDWNTTRYEAEGINSEVNSKANGNKTESNSLSETTITGITMPTIQEMKSQGVKHYELNYQNSGFIKSEPDQPSTPDQPEKPEYKRSLEETAWLDKNKDGRRDEKEQLLKNVPVTLYKVKEDKTRTKVDETTTDENGHYKFEKLEAGNYEVEFTTSESVPFDKLGVTKKEAAADGVNSKIDAGKDDKGILKGIIKNITLPTDEKMKEDNITEYNKPNQDAGFIESEPDKPSNPDPVGPSDPKPSVTPSVTPSITPIPSTTPTPSGTPTPSATPTPSETPKPSEAPKPSVTPPAEETPTPAPAAGSITVTKNLKVNGTPVGAENQKFYVALFEDEDCTQRVSDVKTLTFQYASSATVTFDNLESGKTYYVSETDENGEAILVGILDSGDIYTADFTNGNIVSVDGKNGSTVDFDNEFEDIPDGFYYVGNLKVTKTLLGSDGKAKNSDKTFYAGVFADADHTKLSDQVAKNIIPLSLNGASSVSDEVEVYMENADSVVKLYVTEVDKNGTPVEKDNSFAYSVTVKDGNATISKDALDARVVITNQEKNNPTPQGGGDTPSTQGGGSNPQSYSGGSSSVTPVKTGDSTPVMAMLLLLAASALVISTVMAKKKKSK